MQSSGRALGLRHACSEYMSPEQAPGTFRKNPRPHAVIYSLFVWPRTPASGLPSARWRSQAPQPSLRIQAVALGGTRPLDAFSAANNNPTLPEAGFHLSVDAFREPSLCPTASLRISLLRDIGPNGNEAPGADLRPCSLWGRAKPVMHFDDTPDRLSDRLRRIAPFGFLADGPLIPNSNPWSRHSNRLRSIPCLDQGYSCPVSPFSR